jgi:hypothetical protein
MEEYVKLSRETYDQLNADSEALKMLMDDHNVLISYNEYPCQKVFYSLAEESDFRSAIESMDLQIQLLSDKLKKSLEIQKPEEKEGFWRSFATAIYRTPSRKRKY